MNKFKVVDYQQDTILLHTGQTDYKYGVYRVGENRPVCLCREKHTAELIAFTLGSYEKDFIELFDQKQGPNWIS